MSNFQAYGTAQASDDETDVVSCRGVTTLYWDFVSGGGVVTWYFRGPAGVWKTIYGGTAGTTAMVFTDQSHSINVYFGGDVAVKAIVTAVTGGTPNSEWQIISSYSNN